MRCSCCNVNLNDFEATRRSATTGEFMDTCNKCMTGLDIATVDRPDLNPYDEVEDDYYDDDDFSLDSEFVDDYSYPQKYEDE